MVRSILCAGAFVAAGALLAGAMRADSTSEKAQKLHNSAIVVDTHDDTTQRFADGKFDLGTRSSTGSIDIPRMREGNLSAIFFSIWIPSKVTGPEAVDRAMVQIDAVREQVRKHPNDFVLATTAADIAGTRAGMSAASAGLASIGLASKRPASSDAPATAINLDMSPSECPQPRYTPAFPVRVCRPGAFG